MDTGDGSLWTGMDIVAIHWKNGMQEQQSLLGNSVGQL